MKVVIIIDPQAAGPLLAVEYNWPGRESPEGRTNYSAAETIRLYSGETARDLNAQEALDLAHGILAIVKSKRQETS